MIAKVNVEYHHWEDFRHRPPPEGLSSEAAWFLVSLSRATRREVPLQDGKGAPFSFWLPDRAIQAMHHIDRMGGGSMATESGLNESRDQLLVESLMEEAIATSQIEGAVTTRRAAKEMLRAGRPAKNRSEQMVLNGYQTIRMLRERTDEPMSLALLHDIQRSMTRLTLDDERDAGRIRGPNDLVVIVDERDNEVVFEPPPADKLPERLARLIDFANASPTDIDDFIHPLVRAAILHFWVAYEHPYADGNGRTARAVFYWSMLKSGYWLFEFLTISRFIHKAPARYYRSFLHSESDGNDLTYFLMFQFDVTERALKLLHARLKEVARGRERIRALRGTHGLNPRQEVLLEYVLKHPTAVVTFEGHQASHDVTYPTARADVLGLHRRAFLVEHGTLRPRRFVAHPKLEQKLTAG
jgi:Fic family protein